MKKLSYLEAMLDAIHSHQTPWTQEYGSLAEELDQLTADLRKSAGEAPVERLMDLEADLYMLGCRRFFLHGFRACLELMAAP